MKRTIATALFVIATLFTVGSASAQAHGAKATVPFAFTVGGKVLPAGTYVITSPEYRELLIQSSDRHNAALTFDSQSDKEPTGKGKLIFAKYGDQYFLHEVYCPAAGMNAAIPASQQEKRAQIRQQANLGGEESVVVAAE